MISQIDKLWNTSPPLTLTAFLLLAAFVAFLPGLWLDHRVITGAPAWLKPAKFAISTAIYSGTMAWLYGYITIWPRTLRAAAWITAIVLIIEVAIIALQAARGTTSHFNLGSPLDATLFRVMGFSIGILWLASIGIASALFAQNFEDPAWGWTLRLAMLITVMGSATGALMTSPTQEQLAEQRMGQPVRISGGHTVGAADGGAGLPGVGWSREHGDLRIPHFFGLHAIQILPLFCLLVSMVLPAEQRLAGVIIASMIYLALFVILTWQALSGHSPLQTLPIQ